MEKWYEDSELDNEIVISSRIRLARNLCKYPFPNVISDEQTERLIDEVKASIKNDRTYLSDCFDFISIKDLNDVERFSLVENHLISPELAGKKKPCGVLLQNDDRVSILLNEEDHIRIQAIYSGYNIDKAFDTANKIDDLIEETVEYAFDKNYGYLTSCPTNTGTGMRASFMLHIPLLDSSGQLKGISQSMSKFGMTLRGIYGEGSEPIGGIYQISNQLTLGISENDILSKLTNITNQIIEQEKLLRDNVMKNQSIELADKVNRSLGLLQSCRIIDSMEAMQLLSNVRLGISCGILDNLNLSTNIYNIMMNIQPGNLQKLYGRFDENKRDEFRAEYLNKMFKQ